MINEIARKKVKDQYGIDIIDDVLFAEDYHVVFFLDFKKREKSEVQILSGDMSYFGFKTDQPIFVKDLIPLIELNNPVSEVIGVDNYIDYLFAKITNQSEVSEIYFPIKEKKGTLWVSCSITTLKAKNDSQLVYGRVNWVSYTMPDAIKYYETTYKDSLTQLFSKDALRYHLERTQATDHSYGLFFDIDNFKRLNDVFGHRAGDKYLQELGKRFIDFWEEDIIYYRVGGDEFFVYMVNSTEEQAYKKAMDVIYYVERINSQGEQVEVSASVGIVPIIGSDFDIENLLDLADRTMYHAKAKGKGSISYARDV